MFRGHVEGSCEPLFVVCDLVVERLCCQIFIFKETREFNAFISVHPAASFRAVFDALKSVHDEIISLGFAVMDFELAEISAEHHVVCEFAADLYRLSVLLDNG